MKRFDGEIPGSVAEHAESLRGRALTPEEAESARQHDEAEVAALVALEDELGPIPPGGAQGGTIARDRHTIRVQLGERTDEAWYRVLDWVHQATKPGDRAVELLAGGIVYLVRRDGETTWRARFGSSKEALQAITSGKIDWYSE